METPKVLDLQHARKMIAEENGGVPFISQRFGLKLTLYPLKRKELNSKKERLEKFHRQRLNLKPTTDLPNTVAAEVFARSFCGTIVAEHWEGIKDGENDVPFNEDNFVQVMTELVPSLWEEIVNFVLAEQQAHDDRMADSGKG